MQRHQYNYSVTTVKILTLALMISIFGFVLSFVNQTCFFVMVFGGVALFMRFLWSPFFKKGCQ